MVGVWDGLGNYVMCQRQYGRTALISAAEYGHSVCVRLLVESGADKDANHVRMFVLISFACKNARHACRVCQRVFA